MRKQTKIAALVSAAALLTIGAAMTSFASGWTMEDGQWVYLNRDGDRVEDEWKTSNGGYYYLGEDGYMVTNQIVKDDKDNIYYVDGTGLRVTNQWVSVDNVDDETVGENTEVDTLWYYFGSTGKAYKSDDADEPKVRTVAWSGGSNKFLFDSEGHMMSGWYIKDGGSDDDEIYYLGDENEGYAHTGWQLLEPEEDVASSPDDNGNPYESEEWFYFQSSGKAYVNTTKYIDKYYYTFDTNGILDDEWLPTVSNASSATPTVPSYHDVNGVKTGWIYGPTKNDVDTSKWFYIVNTSKGKLQAFGSDSSLWEVPYGDEDDIATKTYTAKSIDGKVYIFNAYGEMQDGLVEIKAGPRYAVGDYTPAAWNGVPAKQLKVGEKYYFSKADASQGSDGRMIKGKVTHEDNGETYYYYFDKTSGQAIKNVIKDSTLYGPSGARIQAEDGMSLCLVRISETFVAKDSNGNITASYGVKGIKGSDTAVKRGTLVVTSSGKVKTSGTYTIDDMKYHVNSTTGLVDYCYAKDDKDKTHLTSSLYFEQ